MAFSIPKTIKKLSADIDSAIEGVTANDASMLLFSTANPNNGVNPVYTRSTTCWARNIDTSPTSVWTDGNGGNPRYNANMMNLISPRHGVVANHWGLNIPEQNWDNYIGAKFIFVAMDNTCYIRTFTASTLIAGTDIRVVLLDSDLPPNISFCKVASSSLASVATSINRIPAMFQSYFPFNLQPGLRAAIADYYEGAVVAPANATRAAFNVTPYVGDSGRPACFVYDNKLILLVTFASTSGGANLPDYIKEINSAMTSLGGGYNLSILNKEHFVTKGNILITQQELQSLELECHESYFLKVKDANKEILMNVLNATQFYNSTKLPKKLQSLENFSTYFLKSTGFTLNDIFYKTDFTVGDQIKIQKSSNGQINTYTACGTNCANGWYNYNNETLSANDKITIITANSNKKYFKIKNTGNINIEKCETFIQSENFYKILNSKTISSIFDSNNGDTLTLYTQGKLNGTVVTYYTLNGNWLNPNGQINNTFLIPAGSLFTLNSEISETINVKNNSSVIIQKYINKVYSFNSSTDSIYIYKGGLSNKLIDIFNPTNLQSVQDTIQICGKTYLASGSNWVDPASENTRDDIILKYGDQIILNSQNTLDVNGGAILSKVVDENFNGKIKIYQSENDLIEDTFNFEVFACNNLYWFDESENLLKYDYVIPNEAIIVFDCNYSSTINFSSSAKIKKYNRLYIKKTNTGSGKITAKVFSPKDLIDLQLWLKADAGVIKEFVTPLFISEIVLTDSGESTSDGTYTRSTGGTTGFDGPNENYIYWDEEVWLVYDNEVGLITYVNYDFGLDPESWEEIGSAGAPSAENITSSLASFQAITGWQDQSGNSRNFTKSIANTGYPRLSNGIPLFTAVSKYNDANASILALPSSSLNFTTPYTLIVLLRSGPGDSTVFSKSKNSTKRRKYQMSMNSGIIYSSESRGANLDTSISYHTGTGDYRKRLIVSQYSSNTSGLIRYNSAQVANSSTDVGIDQTNNASIFIGASPFNEGTGYNAEASAEMHVYEIIFYNRALSTLEIEKIEAYLNDKYPSICGFQNRGKLAETSGSDAPTGAVFNNIAFDYSSFASSCSSLGLDPTAILNSLGGVDFSYNYVVIRAKTSSGINADSISNLGNGIINITSIGTQQNVPRNYYRFFVMCKEGWNTVRFYGTDYLI